MLLEHYNEVRHYTESLCSPLQIEDYIPQPEEFTSPPKWHLAHTTWFFEEMILSQYIDDYQVFNKDYGFLFNSYYQTVGKRAIRAQRGLITRPTVAEVYEYRAYIDQQMKQLLESDINDHIQTLVILGLNHEQQHQELLLTDLKYTFAINPTFPVYDDSFNLLADHNQKTGWITIAEGLQQIGFQADNDQEDNFCFDNELGRHSVFLPAFEISKSLVSNGDYIEFIEAGGYENFCYWLDEGWHWIQSNDINSPLYWHKQNNQWHYYTLAGLKPVDENAILAHISFFEANAFANWKGMRLPTEQEWEVASDHFDWGKRWEWTASAYQAYPGFSIREGAVGEYNGKFMINQMVLRGASVATSQGHSRKTYRNFFHPHFQWQYSGIRLAR